MARFNLFSELKIGGFPTSIRMYKTGDGYMHGWGATDPVAGDDYAIGATFQNTTTPAFKVNTGTRAAPTWTAQA